MEALDNILGQALRDFEHWLLASCWRGKENDCVNLFAHKFLLTKIGPSSPLRYPTQMGIEVGVPQPEPIGIKRAVRKDLVLWREPEQTTWDETWNAVREPMAIVEWKARRKASRRPVLDHYDLEWLRQYTVIFPAFTGYCVTVDFTSLDRRLATARLLGGSILEDFHRRGQ